MVCAQGTAFGQDEYGVFPGSTVAKKICRQYQVQVVGKLDLPKQCFYAITAERRRKHSTVLALVEAIRRELHN